MKKWNQINKRLKSIIADGLDVSFNHSPVVKATSRAKYIISFFHVKFKDKIIWEYPKDNAYHNIRFCDKFQPYDNWHAPYQGGQKKWDPIYADFQFASPENIITGYLDLPKEDLLSFEEPTGLRYILWAIDKRIRKKRLQETGFIEQALPIVKERVPEYNLEADLGNSMTLVYTDSDISIFGKSKWKFVSTWNDEYYKAHRFIVADNPSYSLSKHTIEVDFNGQIAKWCPKMVSKNILNLTPEIEEKIITALKSPSNNLENKTVFEELIYLENIYPTSKDVIPEDLKQFEKITEKKRY